MKPSATVLLLCSLLIFDGGPVFAQPSKVDYLRDIKPIFRQHCAECHGAKKQEAGLRLDTAAGVRRGSENGAVLSPGKAAESLLLKAVMGADDVSKMPPEGTPLSPQQIDLLRQWIEQGAPAPAEKESEISPRDHWSFQPLASRRAPEARPDPTNLANHWWAKNAIDLFILARLQKKTLAPSPEADRSTLIRRLSLDLRGLPPSAPEVEEFVGDTRPGAYERLVDRMLASPAYGERWGRHWLDIARYADSNGYTRDFAREIWKYRDWVIGAVNRDMPFDQFTIEQIAGDLLPGASLGQRIATGFHRNTLINEEGGTDPEQFRVEAVADRISTTGVAFLGLTLGCARCHEHKYDPISQREYYQIFAFLNQCDEPTIEAPSAWDIERGLVAKRDAISKQIAKLEKALERQQQRLDSQQTQWEKTITPEERAKLPGPTQAALDVAVEKRTPEQKKLVTDVFKTQDVARKAFPELDKIHELRESSPKIPTTMVMQMRNTPRVTHIHRRGNFLDKGPEVEADTPAALHRLRPRGDRPDRLDFAHWLVDQANPLTPRVIVNRHWQHFFGRGLVETENDFGLQGTPPTHPKLLDDLAAQWLRRRWSVKSLHRLIVTSAVYRQSSHRRAELDKIDPKNELLGRQNRMRLEAEIVRDAALSAAGLLCGKIGGPSVHPPQPDGVFAFTQDPKPWNTEPGGDRYRRGMYTWFWRSSPYPGLMVFDFPNANVTCTRRVRSNTPLQALTLANDEVFMECAQALAVRVLEEAPQSTAERARNLFRRGLARDPSPEEEARLLQLISQQRQWFTTNEEAAKKLAPACAPKSISTVQAAAWTAAARVVLNLDEFITRE